MVARMQIEVKLFANFQDYLPPGNKGYGFPLEIGDGTTIRQLLQKLHIPESIPMITLVNGVHRNFEDPLNPGDVLSVFPPVAGG
jgi:sulfur-carrier protein